MTRRIAVSAVTTVLLLLSATGSAAADPGNGALNGQGPGACFGPPGQIGLVQEAHDLGLPPGQFVAHCNGHGNPQDQTGGGGVAT